MENIKDTQVRIQLIGDIKGYLNVEKEAVFPLTFSISDIRDISKKKGTFSKSIILAGDKNNNKLLNNYFDVNIVAGTFNINKLQYCNVIQNGITILENALIQLVSINKEQQNSNYEEKVSYTVLIKDTTSDFFSTINNKYLTDINFTYLNHIYTADNVLNSFYNTVDDGYRYVMPYNPSMTNDNQFDLTEFSPGIFAKTYFDNIFSTAGFRYNWIGMTSSNIQFDKLIIPYTGDVINTEKYEDPQYIVEAHKIGTQSYPNTLSVRPTGAKYWFQTILPEKNNNLLNNNIIDSNPLGLYVGGVYTLPNIPSYTNDVKYELEIEYDVIIQNNATFSVFLRGNILKKNPLSDSYELVSTSNPQLTLDVEPTLYVNRNNAVENSFPIISDGIKKIKLPPTATSYPVGTTILKTSTGKIVGNITGVSANDTLYFTTRNMIKTNFGNIIYNFYKTNVSEVSVETATINLRIKNTRLKIITQVNGEYGYNVPINMNLFVPQKIKQSDFIKSIFTMYNIYCEVDKDNLNTLNLISRDEYYDNGKIADWTKKLDKGKEQELKFLPELQNKKLLLTYKADKDVANESYTKSTNEIFGQLEFTFNNEYVKDITRQELIFSPTPMTNTSFGAVCPMWAGGYPNLNLRILYAGGVYDCDDYVIKNYPGAVGITASVYPHNSHWDKPINPTFDINFGVCSYYLRSDNYGSKTNNNLFNLHWRRTLEQINSGKMLTAYFNLNEIDINRLKLSDKIRIDNSWWNINSIKDYDANSKSPTKVELISIDEGLFIPFETRDVVTINDASKLVSVPRNRLTGLLKLQKNVNLSTTDIPVNGINNVVGAQFRSGSIDGNNNTVVSDSTIIGDNNYIVESSFVIGSNNSASASSIIFGSDNTIDSNVTNSFVVGTGIIATQSDTVYSSNIVVPDGGTINNVPVEDVIGLWQKYDDTTISTGPGIKTIQLEPSITGDIPFVYDGMVLLDNEDGRTKVRVYNGYYWDSYMPMPREAIGRDIDFIVPAIYNKPPLTPETRDILQSSGGYDYPGIIQKIYHEHTTAPTFPVGWVLLEGTYNTSTLNIIYAEYVSSTRVEYWIIN